MPIRIFVGYDRRTQVNNWVFKASVLDRTRAPVSFQDVSLDVLTEMGCWWRPRHPNQSTDFAFSRFLVPYLCEYKGWALFVDGDMVCRTDLANLWTFTRASYAVSVVQHGHIPQEDTKFLGQVQTKYPRKNWSSVMLFNCAKCKALTVEAVNTAEPAWLHGFKWIEDSMIGRLPRAYNHLVGHYPYNPEAAIAHFTAGTPAFAGYENVDYADEWRAALRNLTYCEKT